MTDTGSHHSPETANWNAVWSLTSGVVGLIIGEFLPAGVLTPIARDFGISEGMAGQTVTATSIMAVLTSLLIAYLTRHINRKVVLLTLSSMLSLSSLIVAFATNFEMVLFGRVLLGLATGGFWSMATAITIRLVPEADVPKALSLVFGGSSFASILAAPMGSFFGEIVGWRNIFLIAAALGFVALIWQYRALPTLEPRSKVRLSTTLDVIRTPQMATGLLAIMFVFCGRFASFTYLRPFLEQTTGVGPTWVSFVLLLFGVGYFAGNWLAPVFMKRDIRIALLRPPVVMAFTSVGLIMMGGSLVAVLPLVLLWGISYGPVPPAWSAWVAKKVPEHAETGGGLYVASVQASASLGSFFGGMAYDLQGSNAVFLFSFLSWTASALLVLFKIRTLPAHTASAGQK